MIYALCNDASHAIIYVSESPLVFGRFYLEREQWIEQRDRLGRICTGKSLGHVDLLTDIARERFFYRYGPEWARCSEQETRAKREQYQHGGLPEWKDPGKLGYRNSVSPAPYVTADK